MDSTKMHLFIVILALINVIKANSDSFSEELILMPLTSNKIYTHFQFTTKWDVDSSSDLMLHSNLFPRAVSEVLLRHNVQELHISLTAGLWRYETWGYPMIDAPPGAEVWAWFKPDTQNVNTNWKGLSNSLSGLLCSSLNFIDETNSINPDISFRPTGVVDKTVNSSLLRYSALPREVVCTENLTPWKKLLPCDSKAGLATLLNAGYIHNTHYHSIGIHVRPICANPDCSLTSLELKQTVSLVYDYTILGGKNWSFRKLFGQGLLGACPLATDSLIYIDVSSNSTSAFTLSPQPDELIESYRGATHKIFAKYDVKKAQPMSIAATYTEKEVFTINIPPPLYSYRYKTGYGQQQGGIVTKIYNNHWSELEVVVLQNFPWYVPVYLHTLKIEAGTHILNPKILNYHPGKLRQKPHLLELVLKLPPKSVTSISIDFDYVFLKWQEYPPDANHGFYIGSATISCNLPLAKNFTGLPQDGVLFADSFNASRSAYLVQVCTESMIITLPTPDFSMPYNVICLACTVVALAFGPLHNITTKRLILKINEKRNVFEKLKLQILSVFKK